MIDRNIRANRTKEEERKARLRGLATAVCLIVLFNIVFKVQKFVSIPFTHDGKTSLLGILAAFAAGLAVVGAVLFLVYKLAKNRSK